MVLSRRVVTSAEPLVSLRMARLMAWSKESIIRIKLATDIHETTLKL